MDDERPACALQCVAHCCFRRIHLCICPVLMKKGAGLSRLSALTSTPEGVKATSPMLLSGLCEPHCPVPRPVLFNSPP